jgi:hypothetical protein
MREFATQIYAAVRDQRLKEPFGPEEVRRACPGWAQRTYSTFLPKHAVGNPGKTSELFEWVGPGQYRTIPKLLDTN